MEAKKFEAETILGVQSPGGHGRLEDMPVCLQYLDQKHELCELVMPAREAVKLMGYLQSLARRYGISIPPESLARH